MAKTFSPVLRAGDKSIPIKGPAGEELRFYCDFQWASGNFLCAPFFMRNNRLIKARGAYNFRYSRNGGKDKYLSFPDYYFSLASYSFGPQPECFMFPRYRKESAVVCVKIPAEQYLAANTESNINVYRATAKPAEQPELIAVPFSQFDAQYKFETLPLADDGTYWGVKYDDAFYGGIKRII